MDCEIRVSVWQIRHRFEELSSEESNVPSSLKITDRYTKTLNCCLQYNRAEFHVLCIFTKVKRQSFPCPCHEGIQGEQ